MPSGKQGSPEGLAKEFVEYVRARVSENKWTLDDLSELFGMSRNYIATRLRGQGLFNLKDFEAFAKAVDMEPQELLLRVQLPAAHGYPGRLVPSYEVVSTSEGAEVYLTEKAGPGPRPNPIVRGRFPVGASGEDEELAEASGESTIDHDEDTADYDA